MQLMVTDSTRRNLLKAALGCAAVPVLPFGCASNQSNQVTDGSPKLIGCALNGRDRFSAVVADQFGQPISQLPIPERGHGVAISPKQNHAVVFARRPGNFFIVFDYMTGQQLKMMVKGNNRHFYGHGVYSLDGRYLYATEGKSDTSEGVIGVYDVEQNYAKVEEFSGFGIGPHEVIIMPSGDLAIGVGGVHTDGRTPKNLDTMKPSLTYLSATGQILDQVGLPDKKLSIRHLAHDGAETVLCGQQYRGEPDEYPSLLAMHTKGGEFVSLNAEPEQWSRFNHYIASIAASEEWILATSPRGNCYGIWSKETRELVELSYLADASGVVLLADEFRLSSGAGGVISQSRPHDKSTLQSGIQWDNHWSAT